MLLFDEQVVLVLAHIRRHIRSYAKAYNNNVILPCVCSTPASENETATEINYISFFINPIAFIQRGENETTPNSGNVILPAKNNTINWPQTVFGRSGLKSKLK